MDLKQDQHGDHGDGKGIMANRFAPPPRNFKCAETMRDVPDGQLYWIIKNGSDGTAMPATKSLGKRSPPIRIFTAEISTRMALCRVVV